MSWAELARRRAENAAIAAGRIAPAAAGPRADSSHVVSIQRPEDWGDGPDRTVAGVCVNEASAMRLAAFWGCVRRRGEVIGSLPLPVYRMAGDVPVPARGTPLWTVLHDSPNADQTPTDYWEFASISLDLRGNHYARIHRRGDESVVALEPIRPDIVQVRRKADGRIGYRWSQDGRSFDLDQRDVFHVRGFGGGPLGGLSPLTYARQSLGIAIAADRAAGAMFANGVQPSGVLKFKDWLDEQQRSDARGELVEQFVGAHNAGRPFILEGGADWQQIAMTLADAQLLESRAWSVEDICRWFGMPPPMIGHTTKTTSWPSGMEQQVLLFQKFSLNPVLRRFRQAIWKQLLTPDQRAAGMFAEFNVEGLLAGDSQGRGNWYRTMTQIGAMTINEVRAKENLPPVPGGDVPRIQIQNAPIGENDGPDPSPTGSEQ